MYGHRRVLGLLAGEGAAPALTHSVLPLRLSKSAWPCISKSNNLEVTYFLKFHWYSLPTSLLSTLI